MAKKSRGGHQRRAEKFPGLKKELHPKSRWEYLDQDYAKELTDEEKKFLSDFNEEYYGGNFQHSGKKLHKGVKAKRECYTRNNARNRDMYTFSHVRGWVVPLFDNSDAVDNAQAGNPQDAENNLVDLLDMKNSAENTKLSKSKKKTTKSSN